VVSNDTREEKSSSIHTLARSMPSSYVCVDMHVFV
jgi:hypothetical protein